MVNRMVTNIAIDMPAGLLENEKNTSVYPEVSVGVPLVAAPKMSMRNVDVFYGEKQAIYNVNVDIGQNEVIAMIGPSGCGKSTFLRSINRMNDTVDSCRVTGQLTLDGDDIYAAKISSRF